MIEIIKKHTKTTNLIKEFFVDQFLQSIKDPSIPEAFKDAALKKYETITDEQLSTLIQANPHALFYFFDKQKLFIETCCDEKGEGFYCRILNKGTIDYATKESKSRLEAELTVIIKCFEILEERL